MYLLRAQFAMENLTARRTQQKAVIKLKSFQNLAKTNTCAKLEDYTKSFEPNKKFPKV